MKKEKLGLLVLTMVVLLGIFISCSDRSNAILGPTAKPQAAPDTTTTGLRQDVNDAFGIIGSHGFTITTPSSLFDGDTHSIYAFGIDLNDVIGGIKFRYANMGKNLSYVDCISYSLARERKLIFVTGDKDFENIENVEFVK